MMPTMAYGSNHSVLEVRERLLFSLQHAYSTHRYDSPSLEASIREFVRGARHRGLGLEWVLDAVQDAIDAGVLPALSDSQRRAFSGPVRRMAEEAFSAR